MRTLAAFLLVAVPASALLNVKAVEASCQSSDLKIRAEIQNKLAGICEDMCKEVGAYPQCAQCPGFVAPDATPGVMTWEELLGHMFNLVDWGQDELKAWKTRASGLLQKSQAKSCATADLDRRMKVQNTLAGICEDMCKEVGAYPQCAQCPGFVAPDATPGVMTWEELLPHMFNLVDWGQDQLKAWKTRASGLLQEDESACVAADQKARAQFQNKLAGICEDMCKEVGAYPQCAQCPGFVAPDATPGVMTWEELLGHMFNLVDWGQDELKAWKSRASGLLQKSQGKSCVAADLNHRMTVQNSLAGICEDMCKEVGAYPQCAQCPGFVAPDATPGVMTWQELLEHMFNLVDWGHDSLKTWKKQASQLQRKKVLRH